MKTFFIICSIAGAAHFSFAQTIPSSAENYTYSKVCLDEACVKKAETVKYMDGLGRPKQIINVKASPTGKDVVIPIEYDGFGRQTKDYLPVPQPGTQNGVIYGTPLANAAAIYGNEKIYADKILEASPLNRIQQQIQVGNAWATHPVQFGYGTNTNTEVKKYSTTTTWNNNATTSVINILGNYPANQLYKNTVTDEDGNVSIEFKNGQGQTILVRKNDGSQDIDTYYVYNEYDQLAFVVPPLAAVKPLVLPADLDNLCYQYRYDGRSRLVEKRLPGKGWEFLVYDTADRIGATKDSQNLWIFTKYDFFNRVVYTGTADLGDNRSAVQGGYESLHFNHELRDAGSFDHDNMTVYYTSRAYPLNFSKLLSVNYYDSYPAGSPGIPPYIINPAQTTLGQNAQDFSVSTKSLPTASYVKNIEDDAWTRNYIWYDTKGRPIGSHSLNHLGGSTITESDLDFAGVVLQSNTRHKRLSSDTETFIHEEFTYDLQNRLLLHKHQVNTQPMVTLADHTYNELSQLSRKKVGNNLQTVDYTYNIRGWMTGINDPQNLGADLFGYQIKYNNPVFSAVSAPKYNGNISEITWNNSDTGIVQRYNYTYDAINRLKNAQFSNPDLSLPHNGLNNETISYDFNGNIANLQRTAKSLVNGSAETIDNLTYNYIGNKVININDGTGNPTGYEGGGNQILYDANGNMTGMPDKNIQNIAYNILNLPNSFSINNQRNLQLFLYRADGVKLRKIFHTTNAQHASFSTYSDYLDGFQYLQTQGSADIDIESVKFAYEQEAFLPELKIKSKPELQFFPTAEGFYDYVKKEYIYQYKDHLGNVRISYRKDGNSVELTDQNDYYPFGMNIPRAAKSMIGAGSLYNYKYQGQELQETGFYSFKWRNYMADLGRFFNIDPLSEKYAYQSNYNFSENKVTSHRELEGLEAVPADNFNKNQSTLVVLGLGRADGRNGDGVGSGSNTLYSNLPQNLQTDGAFASLQNNLGSNIAVAAYTGTDSGLASTHMVETISNYRSVNPNGRVIMIGHSAGGTDILNAASATTENINLVLTMEPVSVNAGGGTAYSSNPFSTSLGSNVQNIISLSADKNMFSGGGGLKTVPAQNSIKATMTGTGHTNIDDSMTPYLKPLIQRTDQGVNPVKWFQNVNWNNFRVKPNVRTGNQENNGTGSGS